MQRHVVSNQWFGSGRARNWNARDYELLICCAFTSDLLCCIFVKLSYLWSFIFVAVALCQNWEVDVSFTSVGDHGACQLAQVRLNEVVRHDFFWWWIMFFFTIYILYIHTSLFVVHTVDSLESSTPPFRNRRIWGPNLRSSFVGSCFNPAAAVPDLCFGKVETCFQIPAAKTPISNRKHSRW